MKTLRSELEKILWKHMRPKGIAKVCNELMPLIEVEIAAARADMSRVGMLRQWLNEDRITDPKKMVTNEQLERWLSFANEADHSFDWKAYFAKHPDERPNALEMSRIGTLHVACLGIPGCDHSIADVCMCECHKTKT